MSDEPFFTTSDPNDWEIVHRQTRNGYLPTNQQKLDGISQMSLQPALNETDRTISLDCGSSKLIKPYSHMDRCDNIGTEAAIENHGENSDHKWLMQWTTPDIEGGRGFDDHFGKVHGISGFIDPHVPQGIFSEGIKSMKTTEPEPDLLFSLPDETFPRSSRVPKRTATEGLAATVSPKRSRAENHLPEDDNLSLGEPAFACPFYRRFPIRHMDCANYKLKRIRDVKQHIQRRHTRDFFYCPSCYESFSLERIRDQHVRSRQCMAQERVAENNNGVSEEVRNLLKRRVDRAQTSAEQWYSIWDIIFSGVGRPEKPYLGNMVEETMGMMSDFWNEEATRIMPEFLQSQNLPAVYDQNMAVLMAGLFREVQVRFQKRTLGTESGGNDVLNSSQSLTQRYNPLLPPWADAATENFPEGCESHEDPDLGSLGSEFIPMFSSPDSSIWSGTSSSSNLASFETGYPGSQDEVMLFSNELDAGLFKEIQDYDLQPFSFDFTNPHQINDQATALDRVFDC